MNFLRRKMVVTRMNKMGNQDFREELKLIKQTQVK